MELKKLKLKKMLFVVIVFSFILKLIVGFYLKDSFLKRGNSHTPMNAIAVNLLENSSYQLNKGIPSIDYEPLYPGLMALSYKLFGMNWFGLTLFQGILFALSSWLLLLIGKTLMDELAGFFAALYHSFYPYLFFYSLSIYDTTLFVFLYLLIVYLLTNKSEKPNKYAMIGGILGLAMLTRGSIIAFMPAILLYIFIKSLKSFNLKFLLNRVLLLSLFCLLVLAPWLYRNYKLTGRLLVSTHGSFGLWQGNNVHSYNLLKKDISLDEIYRMRPLPEIYLKYPNKGRPPLEAIEIAKVYRDVALSFIKNNPGQFSRLAILKFKKFWSWKLNPITSNLEFGNNDVRKLIYSVSYIPLLVLMPFGMLILQKQNKMELIFIFGIILFYTLVHMIAMGFTRARLPLDCLLMLFVGFSVSFLINRIIRESNTCFSLN